MPSSVNIQKAYIFGFQMVYNKYLFVFKFSSKNLETAVKLNNEIFCKLIQHPKGEHAHLKCTMEFIWRT
jgi:hypothetical protein